MDMTFKDYMLACENYEHSRENLELMKESAEIEVLNQYIENQLFAQNNASLYENAALAECLTESVDNGNFEAICESAKNKSEGFIKKIYNGLAKIIKVFSSLLKKIGNVFDETTSRGQELVKAISQAEFDENQLKNFEKLCDDAATKSNGFVPFAVQPYAKKINFKTDCNDINLVNRVRAKLAAALSNTVVQADVSMYSKQTIGALSIEDIMDIKMGLVLNPKKTKIQTAVKSLLASWVEAKSKGITIRVNTKAIDNSADKLNDLQLQITDLINKYCDLNRSQHVVDEYQKMANTGKEIVKNNEKLNSVIPSETMDTLMDVYADGAQKGLAMATDILNKLYTLVNMTIGSSMRVYSGLNSYRKTVINYLYNGAIKINSNIPKKESETSTK